MVEIIRGKKREAPADWRSLTVTGRARSAIRRHIRSSERDEFLKLGKTTLEQTLTRAGKSLADVSLKPVLETLAIATRGRPVRRHRTGADVGRPASSKSCSLR